MTHLEKLKHNFTVAMNIESRRLVKEYGTEFKVDYSRDFFIRDNQLFVSGETGTGICDYYQEFGTEFHSTIEKLAEEMGYFWEWENPACAVLSK